MSEEIKEMIRFFTDAIKEISNPEELESNSDNRIKQLTDIIFELTKLSEPFKTILGKISATLQPAEEELLELMVMNEIKSFEDIKERGKISWSADIRAEVTDAREFFFALRNTGDDAIAKLQVGPDVITEELLEKIREAAPEEVKIGMQWNSLLAYMKSKLEEAEDKREKEEGEIDRTKEEIYLDEDLWLPGIKMNKNKPKLKITTKKGA